MHKVIRQDELIRLIGIKARFTQKDVKIILDAFRDVATEILANQDDICISNFCNFHVTKYKPRKILKKGVKPQKGVAIREDQKEFREVDYRVRIRSSQMLTDAVRKIPQKLSQ